MRESIESAVENLRSKLSNIFEKIYKKGKKSNENNYSHRCRSQDSTYRGSEKSNFVISCDENGFLEYVMRYRIYSSNNKRDKIYIYNNTNPNPWSNIRQIISERGIIMKVIEDSCFAGYIEDKELNIIDEQFQQIRNLISEYRNQMDIEDIDTMIKNHNIHKLQNFVSHDDKMATEFWKLLFSNYKDKKIKNEVQIIYKSKETILASTERIYQSEGNCKKYKFGIIIQSDKYKGFRINRVSKSSLNNTDKWNEQDIKNVLGYEQDVKNVNLIEPKSGDTRIMGNIIINTYSFDNMMKKYKCSIIDEIKSKIYNLYKEMYRGTTYVNGDVSLSANRLDNTDIKTKDLKELQDKIGIRENDVRKIQRYRNIGRLSARLRFEIISKLYEDIIINKVINEKPSKIRSYKNDTKKLRFNPFNTKSIGISEYKEFATDLIYESPTNISYENINNVSERISRKTFNRKNQDGLEKQLNSVKLFIPYASDIPSLIHEHNYDSTRRFIVPENTTLYCSFEDKSRRVRINKGVYRLQIAGQANHYDYIR